MTEHELDLDAIRKVLETVVYPATWTYGELFGEWSIEGADGILIEQDDSELLLNSVPALVAEIDRQADEVAHLNDCIQEHYLPLVHRLKAELEAKP